MKNEETKLYEELMVNALAGEQSKFRFIMSMEDYKVIKLAHRGLKQTVKLFKTIVDNLTEAYAYSVLAGQDDLEKIIMIKQFLACYEFYKNELNTAKNMLSEYRAYIWKDLKLTALLGAVRTEEEMFDHRKLI